MESTIHTSMVNVTGVPVVPAEVSGDSVGVVAGQILPLFVLGVGADGLGVPGGGSSGLVWGSSGLQQEAAGLPQGSAGLPQGEARLLQGAARLPLGSSGLPLRSSRVVRDPPVVEQVVVVREVFLHLLQPR
ncbi:hypothetical protein LIER_39695 [Lithospermum erythrorhizon]|uniref:Uncharacterized protein n=1 Tax=Lithospermum erythrorhizon TaxID=34254 RepID=A0AAV3QN34_LITER